MVIDELKNKVEQYERWIESGQDFAQAINTYIQAVKTAFEIDHKYGCELGEKAKKYINDYLLSQKGYDFWTLENWCKNQGDTSQILVNLYYEILKSESYDNLESFIYYMEKNRMPSNRFYHPRRKTLKVVVNDLMDLEDGKFKFYGLSLPSRTGKSTLCIFFLAWVAMKRPNSHNAMGGHSGILAKGFYKELMNLFVTEEYTFCELYLYWNPQYLEKSFPTDKSAEEFTITLGRPDRFATITCRGIDGTWTGAVDVSKDGYLYVDDLVRDREHSLSPTRMESTYQEYLNKMVDRKNDGAKELMVGTLWNVLDPLERMRKQFEGNPQYFFRKIPALDENDESNFDYEINGFSTVYYREMRERLDKAEWQAKFMQNPYVREGLLFPSEELRYFSGNIEETTERKTIALCDPAFGGSDSLSMPICADYGDKKKYVIDWVHKKGTQSVTVPLIVDAIAKHFITELHIEQNAGGKLLTDSIKDEMNRRGVHFCNIVTYYASTRLPKTEKIKGYSDWVKENFLFLLHAKYLEVGNDANIEYKRSRMYQDAMDELEMYTSEGKNPHDDAPDALSQLAIVFGKKRTQTMIIQSPI